MNIHELLKINCMYWAIFLLHTLVPPERGVSEKGSEEVLNISHSSSAAFAKSTRLVQGDNGALNLSTTTIILTFFGCLHPVCNSSENNLLTTLFYLLLIVGSYPGFEEPESYTIWDLFLKKKTQLHIEN